MFEGIRMRSRGRRTEQGSDALEIATLRKHIVAGSTVFDVGANKGGYLAPLADATGREGTVYGFEPIPALALRLEKSVRQLRWNHVHIIQAAASDTDGTARLTTPDGERHWESSLEHIPGNSDHSFEVPTIRLDSMLPKIKDSNLTAIKIDVEGHESAVIRGAGELIKQHRPFMLVEVEARHRPDADPTVFFAEMEAQGYQGWFTRDGNRHDLHDFDTARDQSNPEQYINNFAFTMKS